MLTSLQRGDFSRCLQRLSFMKSTPQFTLVECRPFDDKATRPRWKFSFYECQGFYIDDGFVASINGVEVGRRMVTEIHLNDDAVEAAQFRHVMEGGLGLGKLLRAASRLVACIAHPGRDLFHEAIPDVHLASIGPVQILQLPAK